jgi:hypothetical protein
LAVELLIPFEQIKPDCLIWGCFGSAGVLLVGAHLLVACCLLQLALAHGLDEGARADFPK